MKKTILILAAIVLFFAGCKKFDEIEPSKVELRDETIERGWDYIKISGEYDYLVVLEAMTLYLSETEDMSGANTYECIVEGKKFSVEANGLKDGTTYHYQYEYDNGYTKEKGLKGNAATIGKPIVTTNDVTNITSSSAICGGNVTFDGNSAVTSRGVCWSTSPNPTINDNIISDGGGTGSFTSNLKNLTANTTYYVRAYATNKKVTSYGVVKSFKTKEKPVNQTISVNGVSFTMIAVEGSTFQMGAQNTDPDGANYDSEAESEESPVHSVTLSDYYIGETEVTQKLWEAVMGSNPSSSKGDQKPVEQVSWNDCKEFIEKLNNLTGKNFRLPTEAEWEYAARGGNKSQGYKYSGSNNIEDVAWYWYDIYNATHLVKRKSPNELGIYDMSGNVWEWCEDWLGNYSSELQINPTGPSSGSSRVYRGGGWYSYARGCRVSYRGYSNPDIRRNYLGLRLCLSK